MSDVPKVGTEYVSELTGLEMKVTAVTKKEITVDVQRRRVDRKTAEVKYDRRTRVVPMHLWGLCSHSYRRAT